jgi:hypothetical protein
MEATMPTHKMHQTIADRIASALDAVDVTTARHFNPHAAQSAWATLKQARGQSVDLCRLTPAHMIDPGVEWPTFPPDASTAEITLRARLRIKLQMRHRGLTPRRALPGAA